MSTSTRPTTLAEDLLAAVQQLATVTPYADPPARFTAAEWRVYADGYYRALCQALRVMDFQITQREARALLELDRDRRAARRYLGVILARERARPALVRRSGAA